MTPPRKAAMGRPADWLAHAESDLHLAQTSIADKDVLPAQICFHAQQAAEKAFKAVLLERGVDFPPSHDMEELLVIFEQHGVPVPDDLRDASLLTPYAVETRYPGYLEEVTRADAEKATAIAAKALEWARSIVKK